MVNEFRFTAQRNNNQQAFPARKLPTPSDLGVGITSDDPTGPPRIGFYDSGLNLGFSPQGPTTEINNTYNWTDTFSWVKGRHGLRPDSTTRPSRTTPCTTFMSTASSTFTE